MNEEILYTVKEVCDRYGITRKTLFYYDKTGLVKPSKRIGTQQHKVYDREALNRLEQVLTYRSAGLNVEETRTMLAPVEKDATLKLLEKVRIRLLKEKDEKEQEIENIEKLIEEWKEV